MVNILEGSLIGTGIKVGIVVTRFNEFIHQNFLAVH